jgi:homoserine kinase type II
MRRWNFIEIERLMQAYDLGKLLAVEHINKGYSHFNYKLTFSKKNYLLKQYLATSTNQINYIVSLLKTLHSTNIPCPKPIANNEGQYLIESSDGKFILYEFMAGQEPSINWKNSKEMGRALAQFHAYKNWRDLYKKNPYSIDYCQQVVIEKASVLTHYPLLHKYFSNEITYLQPILSVPLPQGLIHGDIFTDNILFIEHQLSAFLDFESACTDNLMMDIGIAVHGFCFQNNILNIKLLASFLEGYQELRSLQTVELELLSNYIRWGGLSILGRHCTRLTLKHDQRRYNRMLELISRTEFIKKMPNLSTLLF